MCDECACSEHSYCCYETIDNNNHIFLFYTLLYNIAIGRWIINDFPLVLLYLDSLTEYHNRLAVITFPIVSDKSCHHSLCCNRERKNPPYRADCELSRAQSRNHILDGIKKLRDQGATIVYTTHYMEEVEILCDRIIILDKGKIIAQGTSDELKKETNIEEKIERVGPTLNDVFLKLTGKELRD